MEEVKKYKLLVMPEKRLRFRLKTIREKKSADPFALIKNIISGIIGRKK